MPERERVLSLLRRHATASTSFQVLEPGFHYFFPKDACDACVAYVDTGRAWVVAGPPIAAPERAASVARAFVAEARRARRRVRFFAVSAAFAREADLASIPIGLEASWDPRAWAATLAGARRIREQLRRARAKHVTVRLLAAEETVEGHPTRAAIERVIVAWLSSRPLAAMGFLVDVRPWDFASERVFAVAERDGAIVAFAAAVPIYARSGFLLEDLLRTAEAPNGTTELLVDLVFRTLAARGATHVTMGLAPLAGDVGAPLRAIRSLSRALYNFDGVLAFKKRLRPSGWTTEHLAFPRGSAWPLAIHDVLAAFATGGFLHFGIRSLHRQRRAVVLVLAALLVPWALFLAHPSGSRWFPSPTIQASWILFDVLLAAALFGLVRRWHGGFAALLAIVTALDALVTLVQVVVWDLPRAHGPLAAVALVIAVLAPAAASSFLWMARRPELDRI